MIKYKVRKSPTGSVHRNISLFGTICFSYSKTRNCGWFRLFGIGITWTHNRIKPMFSERIGIRKKITIGNYRYGYLKPFTFKLK